MTDPTLLLPREHPQPRRRAAVTEPRPRAVYLRRRITAIVILVVVVVLLGWLIASAVTRSATPSPEPWPADTPLVVVDPAESSGVDWCAETELPRVEPQQKFHHSRGTSDCSTR